MEAAKRAYLHDWQQWTLLEILFLLAFGPLRLLLLITGILWLWACGMIVSVGASKTATLGVQGWRRRIFVAIVDPALIAIQLVCGVWRVNVRRPLPRALHDTGTTIVANHVSLLDVIVLARHAHYAAFVSKADVAFAACSLLLAPMRAAGCVLCARPGDKHVDGFSSASTAIVARQRAAARGVPNVVIFGEGTTTNGSVLANFRSGAFVAGAPVVPVALRYPYTRFNPSFESIPFTIYLLRILAQPSISVELEFLPLYTPSAEERASPKLYASNVRRELADALGVPMLDVDFDDKRALHAAMRDGRVDWKEPLNKKTS